MESNHAAVIEPGALDDLIRILSARGFRVLGPTVRDGAIVYDELDSAAELPIGIADRQKPGSYRLENDRVTRRVIALVNRDGGRGSLLAA